MSKALADRLEASYISLTDLVKDEDLTLGVDKERGALIADLRKLSKRVKDLISKATGDIIVEGHYASDVVPPDRASYVFVLRRDPRDLKVKLEEREYGEKKVLENVASEALDVCLSNAVDRYGVERVDEIDMTGLDVEGVVREILQVLNGQTPTRVGKVDWLGVLEAEGRLDEFLSKINWL